jgi:hypothetical protein
MLFKKKKAKTKVRLKKMSGETIIIIEQEFDAKDTLFPEKVAEAKRILSKTNFNGLI